MMATKRKRVLEVKLDDGTVCLCRRLGVGDYFALIEIAHEVLQKASTRSQLLEALSASTGVNDMLLVLFAGMSAAGVKFPAWLESLPVDKEEELFGADHYAIFVATLTGPDFTCFLDFGQRLKQSPIVASTIQSLWDKATQKKTSSEPST